MFLQRISCVCSRSLLPRSLAKLSDASLAYRMYSIDGLWYTFVISAQYICNVPKSNDTRCGVLKPEVHKPCRSEIGKRIVFWICFGSCSLNWSPVHRSSFDRNTMAVHHQIFPSDKEDHARSELMPRLDGPRETAPKAFEWNVTFRVWFEVDVFPDLLWDVLFSSNSARARRDLGCKRRWF